MSQFIFLDCHNIPVLGHELIHVLLDSFAILSSGQCGEKIYNPKYFKTKLLKNIFSCIIPHLHKIHASSDTIRQHGALSFVLCALYSAENSVFLIFSYKRINYMSKFH